MARLVTTVIAVLVSLGAASAASAAPIVECGSAGTVYGGHVRLSNVTARAVACPTARRFVRSFTLHSGQETDFTCDEDFRCTWRRWRCRNDGRSRRYVDHRCVRGARVVRWQARSR